MAVARVEFSCESIVPETLRYLLRKSPRLPFICRKGSTASVRAMAVPAAALWLAKDSIFFGKMVEGLHEPRAPVRESKVGDYLRAVRTYEQTCGTRWIRFRSRPPQLKTHRSTAVHQATCFPDQGLRLVGDMPRRGDRRIVVINTTQTTATGMVVFFVEMYTSADGF